MNLARSDDYQDGNGNRVHSAYERWNTSLQTGWTPSEQHRVNVSLGLSDGEAAYADRGMDGSRFRRESTALGYRGTDLTDWLQQVEAQYFYNYVDHVMDNFSLRQFTPGMMMNPAASNPDRRTHGGRIRSRLALSDAVELELGIDGQSNTHRARMSMNQSLMPVQEMARRTDAQMSQWGT